MAKLAQMQANPSNVHITSRYFGEWRFSLRVSVIVFFHSDSGPPVSIFFNRSRRRLALNSANQGTAMKTGPIAPRKSLVASNQEYVKRNTLCGVSFS